MHTCFPSHGLKISWHWCPRWVNAGNKNTLSLHDPWRQNVTTSMVGLRNGHIRKNLTQKGEPRRYSWKTQKKKKKSMDSLKEEEWSKRVSDIPPLWRPEQPVFNQTKTKAWMVWRIVVCWLLNVPATCQCISGTDLHRQFYVLPHWDRSCRSNFPSHPVTVYWHRADQSQRWPYNARRLAG